MKPIKHRVPALWHPVGAMFISVKRHEREKQELVPHNWNWIACYPVSGTSEGHYVHCDFIVDRADGRQLVRLALGKTFRGMEHAAEMAKRCAIFLGA